MFNKQWKVSRRALLVFAVILCVSIITSSFVTYKYVVAQSASLTTQTLSGGIYPGAPTYTVWTEDGYYYSKDPYGVIVSSASAYTILHSVSTALSSSGGKIVLEAGNYTYATTWLINTGSAISIIGTSSSRQNAGYGTTLQYSGTGSAIEVSSAGLEFYFADFALIGTGSGGSTGDGIQLNSVGIRTELDRLDIENFGSNGIELVGTVSVNLQSVSVQGCGGAGLKITGGSNLNQAYASRFVNNSNGIEVDAGLGNLFVGCDVESNSIGLLLTGSNSVFNTYRDGYFENNTVHAEIASSSWENTILNNYFDAQTTICINNAVNGQTIRDNKFPYAFLSYPTQMINVLHGGDVVHNNLYFVTENNGTSYIPSGAHYVTFSHGCSYTPVLANINIMPETSFTVTWGNYWISSITSTDITLYLPDAAASDWHFGWSINRNP